MTMDCDMFGNTKKIFDTEDSLMDEASTNEQATNNERPVVKT